MEYVVLVDEKNCEVGTAEKETVHTKTTPLHRGFSLFLFNKNGQLLLTQRARTKKTFPGVWTNTVCGHPAPNEAVADAAKRRLKDELGIEGAEIKEAAPYRYRVADNNGIFENEICPILVGFYNGDPKPNPDEVGGWQWINWDDFLENTKAEVPAYSPWSIGEAKILATKKFLPKDLVPQ